MTVLQENYHLLGELTWEDAKQAFRECDFVALVTGSHEQHSTHLPLLTDSIVGEYFTDKLIEEANKSQIKIIRLPILWLGYSEEHRNFLGTVTLRARTLESILLDIAGSLKRHGVRRFLIINAHGGNTPVLQLATDRIERDLDLRTYLLQWSSFGDYPKTEKERERPEPIKVNHAGDIETSLLMYARPDLLRADRMRAPKLRSLEITRSWWGARYWEDFTDTGSGSDPKGATQEFGKAFIERAVANTIYALRRDLESEKEKKQKKKEKEEHRGSGSRHRQEVADNRGSRRRRRWS